MDDRGTEISPVMLSISSSLPKHAQKSERRSDVIEIQSSRRRRRRRCESAAIKDVALSLRVSRLKPFRGSAPNCRQFRRRIDCYSNAEASCSYFLQQLKDKVLVMAIKNHLFLVRAPTG